MTLHFKKRVLMYEFVCTLPGFCLCLRRQGLQQLKQQNFKRENPRQLHSIYSKPCSIKMPYVYRWCWILRYFKDYFTGFIKYNQKTLIIIILSEITASFTLLVKKRLLEHRFVWTLRLFVFMPPWTLATETTKFQKGKSPSASINWIEVLTKCRTCHRWCWFWRYFKDHFTISLFFIK